MDKYAVAVCFGGDNEIIVVEVNNELEAMVEAVGKKELWRIKKTIPFNSVDEGINFYLQGDTSVSAPLKL